MNTTNTEFTDKRVLVTGALGGIGSSLVTALMDQGACVALTDRSADDLNGVCTGLGPRAIALPGDLTDTAFCNALPGAAAEQLGGLDIVINNAGIIRRGNILDTTDEDWHLTMSVNVDAVFRVSREAIRYMTAQASGGAIVNVASCWGLYPGPDHVAYCTSKAAVAAMTRCLGRDHAGDGIRVNAVAPNEVDTPMLRTGFAIRGLDADTGIEALNRSVPLGRIATPRDIVDVILFLASEQARYLCGACIEVNGGKPVY